VPQQIFGASVETVTSASAVLTWSTTVAEATAVEVVLAGEQPTRSEEARTWTTSGTDHAVTLTGLQVNTSSLAYISANETEDVVLSFTTSDVVDETPPDVLNLAVEVLEDGRVTITWYTSESATELILIDGTSVHEDAFATRKNHAHTTDVLADGTYALEVIGADASGNSNTSTLTFEVSAGATVEQPEVADDTTEDGSDAGSDESNTTLQVLALAVLVLVLLAFLRVRGHEPDEDDPWL
jgi:hypothetical protein